MKWDNDKNQDLKKYILDFLVKNLPEENATKITFAMLFKGIDRLFEELEVKMESNQNDSI
jgi:hypothetical protein